MRASSFLSWEKRDTEEGAFSIFAAFDLYPRLKNIMDSLKERAAELKKKQEEQASQEQAEKNKNAFELACTPISLSQVRSERHFMRYPLFSTDQR